MGARNLVAWSARLIRTGALSEVWVAGVPRAIDAINRWYPGQPTLVATLTQFPVVLAYAVPVVGLKVPVHTLSASCPLTHDPMQAIPAKTLHTRKLVVHTSSTGDVPAATYTAISCASSFRDVILLGFELGFKFHTNALLEDGYAQHCAHAASSIKAGDTVRRFCDVP